MFTGLVEGTGTVEGIEPRGDGVRLTIRLGPIAKGVEVGDSIAISGCCLTVTALEGDLASFDAIPETLERTGFASVQPGGRVNLERSLRVGDRLGGHMVQGHVDGVARCTGRVREGGDGADEGQVRFDFEGPASLTEQMVMKGSVTIDGVSLTLIHVAAGTFAVAIIPHTLAITTFGGMQPGDVVNIEGDVIGKWVRKAVAPYLEGLGGGAV
jgi:riboflavin synthase